MLILTPYEDQNLFVRQEPDTALGKYVIDHLAAVYPNFPKDCLAFQYGMIGEIEMEDYEASQTKT